MCGENFVNQAYYAILQGDYERAITLFTQAIVQEPTNADYYYRASITCLRSNKIPLALTFAKKACELEADSETYTIQWRRVQCQDLLRSSQEELGKRSPDLLFCCDQVQEAVRLDPLCAEASLLLGIIYHKQENYHLATAALLNACFLDPDLKEASHHLAQVRATKRNYLK